MKKILIIPACALSLSFLASCQPEAVEKLSLEIDASSVKKEYFVGDTFTSYGLVVSLNRDINGEVTSETLSRNDYSISIEEGYTFSEPSENLDVIISYKLDETITSSYSISVTKLVTLEEAFTNYSNSKNYSLDIEFTNLDTNEVETSSINFTENAVYYSTIKGGYGVDLEGNVFSYYIKDNGEIRPGEMTSFDGLYVDEGRMPAVWAISDIDYRTIITGTPDNDGYYEINDFNNIQTIWQMMAFTLVQYMEYRASCKVNQDGTLTFLCEMRPQAGYEDYAASSRAVINTSIIGETVIPGIDEYIKEGNSSYLDFTNEQAIIDALTSLKNSRNYTLTIESKDLNIGLDPIDKTIKFTDDGYIEYNNLDATQTGGYFNLNNSTYSFYYNETDGYNNGKIFSMVKDFWTLFSGFSKLDLENLKTKKLSESEYEILDKNNTNAISLAINPYLFGGIYLDDYYDELTFKINGDGTYSYNLNFGNEGSISVSISGINSTVIEGLDEYMNTFVQNA